MEYGEPLYVISVAARLVGLHAQTLRKYERVGLVEPNRTGGKFRLYSPEDIERLRQIKYLVDEAGINLAGVELALELTERLTRLSDELEAEAGSDDLPETVGRHIQEMLKVLGTR